MSIHGCIFSSLLYSWYSAASVSSTLYTILLVVPFVHPARISEFKSSTLSMYVLYQFYYALGMMSCPNTTAQSLLTRVHDSTVLCSFHCCIPCSIVNSGGQLATCMKSMHELHYKVEAHCRAMSINLRLNVSTISLFESLSHWRGLSRNV